MYLCYADSGVDVPGIGCIAAILVSCPKLRFLNISRNNLVVIPAAKIYIELALTIAPSIRDVFIGNCGLSDYCKRMLLSLIPPTTGVRRNILTWHENTLVLAVLAGEVYNSRNIERRLAKVMFNAWQTVFNPKPSQPEDLKAEVLNDLGLDIETAETAMDVIGIKNPPSDVPRQLRTTIISICELIKW